MSEQSDRPTHKQFNDPVSVARRSRQKLHLVARGEKAALLAHMITHRDDTQAVVITKTKRDADALSAYLQTQGINALAIHGNKRAAEYEAAAHAFSKGELKVLITTDMVLKALGLENLSLIVSYDLPSEPEHYVGRLGAMSATGEAVSLVSPEEQILLEAVEWLIKHKIPSEELEGFESSADAGAMPQRTKDLKKKPRHRKQKDKTGSRVKEKNGTPDDEGEEGKR